MSAPVKIGEYRSVLSTGLSGPVVAYSKGRVSIETSFGRIEVSEEDTSVCAAPQKKVKPDNAVGLSGGVRNVERIDIHGARVDEVEELVGKAVDDSLLGGAPRLLIIHGKGSGKLGRAVQSYLRARSEVKSCRYADVFDGSYGATVAEFQ